MTSRSTSAAAPLPLGLIVLSAIIGGAGALLVLGAGTKRTAVPAATPGVLAVAHGAGAAARAANPWPDPVARAAAPVQPSAAVAERDDRMALDDAALARRAREEFGFDCPAIAERSPRRSGHVDFTCTDGTMLRAYVMSGELPRIGAVD